MYEVFDGVPCCRGAVVDCFLATSIGVKDRESFAVSDLLR
jgi:hypothetical protein